MKKAIKRTVVRVGIVLCSIIGLLQPLTVSALGLGEMEVNSHLYERFDASIPVISQKRVDPAQIKIKLGSTEDFRRAGISRPYYLNSLSFDLVYKGGQNVLSVTSPEVLREPFLNFLLEVRWPGGKMLKEYTVLVDPPVNDGGATSDNVSSQKSSSYEGPTSSPVADTASQNVESTLVVREVAPAKKFRGSAADLLPSAKDAQPSANNLSSAQPAQTAAVTSPTNDSSDGLLESNGDSGPTGSELASSATTDSTDSTTDSSAIEDTSAVESGEQISQEASSGSSALAELQGLEENADNQQLRSDLATSLENLDKAKIENEQLEDRIQSVETQVEDFERLIELKNKEIDAVTQSIERKQAESGSTGSSTAEQVNAGSNTSGSSDGGLFGQLSMTVLLLILAGVVLLLLLILFLFRGRRGDYQATVFAEDGKPATNVSATVAPAAEEVDGPANDPHVAEVLPSAEDSDETDAVQPAAMADDDEPEDPVAEADIYMAYGRHAQAVSMLKHAIEDDPQRTDIRLKLLEVLKDEGTLDENTYLVEAQRQQILNDAPDLEPEINAILGGGADVQSFASDEALSLDVELDTDFAEEPVARQEEPVGSESPAQVVDSEALAEEVETKLELARTYFDMGDFNGAKEILLEVVEEGNSEQQEEAQSLLKKIA